MATFFGTKKVRQAGDVLFVHFFKVAICMQPLGTTLEGPFRVLTTRPGLGGLARVLGSVHRREILTPTRAIEEQSDEDGRNSWSRPLWPRSQSVRTLCTRG